jgi:hypothetical protein
MIRDMPSFSEVLRRNMRAERARKRWGQDKLGRALGGWSRSRVSALESPQAAGPLTIASPGSPWYGIARLIRLAEQRTVM